MQQKLPPQEWWEETARQAELLLAEYQRIWKEFAEFAEGLDQHRKADYQVPTRLREREVPDAPTVRLLPCEPLYRKEF